MGTATDKAKAIAVAASLLAAPVTSQFEGLMLKNYLDPVGIPSYCYGETEDVVPGKTYTKKQCDNLMTAKLGWVALQLETSTTKTIPVQSLAAFASAAYNLGPAKFKSYNIWKRIDAGDIAGACRMLPQYVYAGKVKLKGLVKRRDAEMELCLTGTLA